MRRITLSIIFAALSIGSAVAAEKAGFQDRRVTRHIAEKALKELVGKKRSSHGARVLGNVKPATHGETTDGPIGSGDRPRRRGNELTRMIDPPGPRVRPIESDIVARDRSADLGIERVFNPVSFRPLYYASIGSYADHVVRVRNYGSVGKTVYVAVIRHSQPRLSFRTVRVFVPARETRDVTLPVRVLSAPINDGYYRATITLMRTSAPGLSDVFQDANPNNNVIDVRIPVRPRRINIDGG